MSSIYRKGRDGYFYYQTYVLNPETKKKNKRIFHSLGTKDRFIAIKLKRKYDSRYEKSSEGKTVIDKSKLKLALLLSIPLAVFLFFYSYNIFFNSRDLGNASFTFSEKDMINEIKTTKMDTLFNGMMDMDSSIVWDEQFNIEIETFENGVIPNYTIARVEQISDAFSQAKIYMFVEGQPSSRSLQSLCDKVTKKFSEYSNLVICIYDDTKVGQGLAYGRISKYDSQIENKTWIAFYTYNEVEGPYFDNNPTGYLGVVNE